MTDEKHADSGELAKKEARKERVLETVTAILLGITTLLSAWAAWVGSLHTGHELIHFTESNHAVSSATALYTDATQLVVQDSAIWSSIQNYYLDAEAALAEGDEQKRKVAMAKIEALEEKCSPELKEAIAWALLTGKSPFEMEGYANSYYEDAANLLKESQDILETGKQDNLNHERFGLVAVIYALVLFLLGIAGTFKRSPNRMIIMGTAVVLLVLGFVFMVSIPMPEGFNILDFLNVQ